MTATCSLPDPAHLNWPERQWRLAAGALLPLALIAAPRVLALGDVPLCAFKHATGLPCPLCGGVRACEALAQGDVAAAWALNPGLLPLLAIGALHGAVLWIEAATGRAWVPSKAFQPAWGLGVTWLLAAWAARLAGWA
jgi:hypothetical protein